MEFNEFQTPLDSELVKSLPKECYNDLIETLESVQFARWLTSTERGIASDRPRDDKGRIIVDITKPHIVEDPDFFRQPAINFKKYGRYTNLNPNGNRKSEYGLFWAEEMRRWREGLVRESDGEWIPGQYYFYLNYSPIWKVVERKSSSGKVRGDRVFEFCNFWLGDYLWYHYLEQARESGGHAKLLKCRGVGFSYKLGAMSPCNMYVEPGLPNFHLASDKTFLEGDKGVFGKVVTTLDWIAENTPLPKLRLKDTALEKQLGYKNEYGVQKGLKSSTFGISLKDNPDKARGVRGPLIHYEEDGLFPNLEKAWGVNRKAVEDGDIVYGLMVAGGTGGTEGASFEGSEKLFYNPDGYNIYGIPNVYDKNANGDSKCGFFWGAYMNRARCYHDNGESDVVKALCEILLDRYTVKYGSSDPNALTQKKAEEPIVPQEAVMRTEGTLFPISDLKDYLAEIAPNQQGFVSSHYVGRLGFDHHGEITWKLDDNLCPIRDFPMKNDGDRSGCVEIFEMPHKRPDGTIDPWRYIAGIDPIDYDMGNWTNSLGSIFIFDLLKDRIVAEYTGRPKLANDFYEVCRRLLKFYSAQANYENNLKGLFNYFDKNNCLNLLCDTPRILRDSEMVKGELVGNRAKGTPAGKNINAWARKLQADWMLSKAVGTERIDDKGNPIAGTEDLNLQMIRSFGYLKEAIAWNMDLNTDRVSAMGMCMILREDRAKIEVRENIERVQTVYNDPWFNKFSKNEGRNRSRSFDLSYTDNFNNNNYEEF